MVTASAVREPVVASGIWSFLFQRLAASVVALVVFVTAAFFLTEALIPYENRLVDPESTVASRYFDYMGGLFTGDLGQSYSGGSVTTIIFDALPTTLLIFATGGIFAYLLGSWLGRFSEWNLGRWARGATSATALAFYTMFPPLLVFLLVHFGRDPLLAAREALGLPLDSMQLFDHTPFNEAQLVGFGGRALLLALGVALVGRALARRQGWRLLSALALPAALAALVLAVFRLGIGDQALDVFFFRSTREVEIGAGSPVLAVVAFLLLAFGEVMFVWQAGMADERSEDYVLTARAKAVSEHEVRDRHVARNVVLPVLSRSFAALPFLLTGLIIIEYQVQVGACALAQPLSAECVYWTGGLSTTLFTAVRNVDLPVILGVMMTMGALLMLLRLVAEVSHAVLDPRIRLGGRG